MKLLVIRPPQNLYPSYKKLLFECKQRWVSMRKKGRVSFEKAEIPVKEDGYARKRF
jgi:hypothetical protein